MSTLLAQVSTPEYHGGLNIEVILFSMIASTLLIYDSHNTRDVARNRQTEALALVSFSLLLLLFTVILNTLNS